MPAPDMTTSLEDSAIEMDRFIKSSRASSDGPELSTACNIRIRAREGETKLKSRKSNYGWYTVRTVPVNRLFFTDGLRYG